MLTFEEAFRKAERVAQGCTGPQLREPVENILSGEYVETKYFWFFFQKRDLSFSTSIGKSGSCIGGMIYDGAAFLITKDDTEVRTVYDLRNDPEKMQKHIDDLDAYYSRVYCEGGMSK